MVKRKRNGMQFVPKRAKLVEVGGVALEIPNHSGIASHPEFENNTHWTGNSTEIIPRNSGVQLNIGSSKIGHFTGGTVGYLEFNGSTGDTTLKNTNTTGGDIIITPNDSADQVLINQGNLVLNDGTSTSPQLQFVSRAIPETSYIEASAVGHLNLHGSRGINFFIDTAINASVSFAVGDPSNRTGDIQFAIYGSGSDESSLVLTHTGDGGLASIKTEIGTIDICAIDGIKLQHDTTDVITFSSSTNVNFNNANITLAAGKTIDGIDPSLHAHSGIGQGGTIDHTNLNSIGTNAHSVIDTHIADGTKHFLEGAIDHTNILSIGTNTHAQIDTHISDSSDPHGSTLTQTTLNVTGDAQGFYETLTIDQGSAAGSTYLNFMTGTRGFVALYDGSIRGLGASANCSTANFGESFDIQIRVNGSSVLSVNLDCSTTGDKSAYTTQARDTDTFSAGDILSFYAYTAGHVAIKYVNANVRIQYDS